jgi:predicted alpha-1,2-mannosidase
MMRALALSIFALTSCAPATPYALADPTMTGSGLARLTQDVDPFIGTILDGNEFPGAAQPFGMVQWSPDTSAGGITVPGGYNYGDPIIRGFSLTHFGGAGCVALGNVLFMPVSKPVTVAPLPNESPYSARFQHRDEHASPGYYHVRLATGIDVQLTTTARTGFGRFTYPAGSSPSLLIDAGAGAGAHTNIDGTDASAVRVESNDEITSQAIAGHFCGLHNRYTVYFAARFDRPLSTYGTWTGRIVYAGARHAHGRRTGIYLGFRGMRGGTMQVQVGLSYVSIAGARANLRAETHGWSFTAARTRADRIWNHLLSGVRVDGGSPTNRLLFYTALYHAFLHPNIFDDADGHYIGFDGRVHRARGYTQYANFSGWDIYRTQIPLLAWLCSQVASDMVTSLIADAKEGGRLPKWPVANDYTGEMDGDSADPIIASAYAFGARHFDARSALREMVVGASKPGPVRQGYEERPGLDSYLRRGWVDSQSSGWGPAATTLEYAIDDFSIGRLALTVGARQAARSCLLRSQNWRHLFDRASGFIEPRDPGGTFPAVVNPTSSDGFVEGNAWQYSWMVPQDLPGLFKAMGGPRRATHRLDLLFRRLDAGPQAPYYWGGNEPDLEVPWEYDAAGEPWRTQGVVRQIMTRLYRPTPAGLPGNDDLGTLSAWYVWSALGLYPVVPGVPGFAVGSPLFPHIVLTVGANRFSIVAPGAGSDRPYIHGFTVGTRVYSLP